VIVSVIFTSFFRGLGQTGMPLVATIAANLVNLVLDYGLVLGRLGMPQWGVFGAGAATSASNLVYLLIIAGAALRPSIAAAYGTRSVRASAPLIRRFTRTSTPIGGQWLLDMASFAVFSTIIVRMGDVSMAANQAMIQLLSLSFMQAYGISVAAGALVGRYVGAGDLASAERSYASSMKLGMALAATVAAMFLLFPEPLLRIFSDDRRVLELGAPLLALAALFQVIDAVGIIVGGSLRGAGDTRWPFFMQASLAWLLRIPVVYACAIALHGGLLGAWVGELVYISVLNVAFVLRFRAGTWRRMRV
jgi:putative MATE family efflux protein